MRYLAVLRKHCSNLCYSSFNVFEVPSCYVWYGNNKRWVRSAGICE